MPPAKTPAARPIDALPAAFEIDGAGRDTKRYEGLGGVARAHAGMEASRVFGKAVVVLA